MTRAWSLVLIAVFAAQAPAQPRPAGDFFATPARSYTGPVDAPMFMPTDVATFEKRVYVADGANGRIIAFDSQGVVTEIINAIGDIALLNPVGLEVDAAGKLWIADAGLQRIIARNPDGSLYGAYEAPPGGPGDFTDIAVLAEGDRAWAVDNDGHRLVLLNMATGEWEAAVPANQQAELFHYPFMLAARGDRLFVSDVANGRIRTIVGTGTLGTVLGEYGIGRGELYRPKGVAIDAEGRVWVSDSVLGTIQIFSADGTKSAELKSADGSPLRLLSPIGLEMVGDQLFVVELAADRVSQFQITAGQLLPRPEKKPAPRQQQPQRCTVCHIDWLPDFSPGMLPGVTAVDPKIPVASRSELCLSCHDTSIADSRERVWRDHGHNTGTALLEGMTPPKHLPLVDGQLACRTCHTAHAHGGVTMETAIFLRVEKSADELCVACHADYRQSPERGFHPTGRDLLPLPESLPLARPKQGPVEVVNGCMVCHSGHGSGSDRLLVPTPSPSDLCVSCHYDSAGDHAHPIGVPLLDKQAAALDMGGRVGADGSLQCLTCHNVHHGRSSDHLLVDRIDESQLCIRCHAEQAPVFGTAHDLRVSAPEELNARGTATSTDGPCSACHAAHTAARNLPDDGTVGIASSTLQLDPSGACASCHRAGECASAKSGDPFSHPSEIAGDFVAQLRAALGRDRFSQANPGQSPNQLACVDCHDPHHHADGDFLRTERDTLCAACHANYTASLSGGHDFTDSGLANAKGVAVEESGRCGFCHSMHQAPSPALWTATATLPGTAEGLCLECHRADGMASEMIPRPLVHPQSWAPAHTRGVREEAPPNAHPGLPLFAASGVRDGDGEVGCATCHNPHANAWQNPALLREPIGSAGNPARGKSPDATFSLCTACHADTASIETSMHSKNRMAEAGLIAHDDADLGVPTPPGNVSGSACNNCHAVHAPAPNWAGGTWVGPTGPSADSMESRRCTGCHSDAGGLHDVRFLAHLRVPMTNMVGPGQPGFMPLVDPAGSIGPAGVIGCVTCHTPHGREHSGGFVPPDPERDPEPLIHATKSMLRPYTAPNLCSTCHGFEGLRLYLQFHRRPGRIGDGTLAEP